MQQVTTIGMSGGFNTDTAIPFYDGNTYLQATNFTSTSTGSNSLGALENARGNVQVVFDGSGLSAFATNHVIVGYANVVKDIVFFTTDGTDSNIYKLSNNILTLVYSDSSSTYKLNFSTLSEHRIRAIGRQETTSINKVYWVDGLNEVRYLDLNKTYTGLEATVFNLIPNNDLRPIANPEVINGAGVYTSGTVYYAYQFYTTQGASSTMSQGSLPTKLSSYTGIKDGGNDKGEDTGCAVKVEITGIPASLLTRFDRIRLYSIYYSDAVSPVINIVAERPIINTSITIVDTGKVVGEITADEFNAFKQTTYVADSITSKDNHLLIGNIEDASFTSDELDAWDGRAYRFNSSTSAKVWDATYSYYITITAAGVWTEYTSGDVATGRSGTDWTIPTDFDCRNKYNDTFSVSLKDRNANDAYKFKSDGSTIGGTGVNVSYEFESKLRLIDTNTVAGMTEGENFVVGNQTDVFGNYSNSSGLVATTEFIECEDGEVYRIGVRFFNEKGQSSFVKWIGDILWEEELTSNTFLNANDNKVSYQFTAGDHTLETARLLKVTIPLSNFPAGVVSWQVVRAKRESVDKTAVAHGQLRQAVDIDSSGTYRPEFYRGLSSYDNTYNLFRFISPDLMYNRGGATNKLEGYKFRVYAKHSNIDTDTATAIDWGTNNRHNAATIKSRTIEALNTSTTTNAYDNLVGINNYKWVTPVHGQDSVADSTVTIGSYQYINQYRLRYPVDTDNYAGGCSTMVVDLDSSFHIEGSDTTDGTATFYGSLIKNTEETRYGGVTYQDIQNTQYIPFSEVKAFTTTDAECKYGDSYTNCFYFMEALFQDDVADSKDSGYILASIPVQSGIDLRRRNDRLLDYVPGLTEVDTSTDNDDFMHPQETVQEGIQFQGSVYDTSIGDLYIYNLAYSADNTASISISKPFDFLEENISTTKVLASEKKINGESEDSWTIFLPANFIEVDSAYGAITDLKVMDSTLFYWQEKGFGKLAVNERSLITDQSGAQLSLGTGSVLERFDYISREVGSTDRYNIVCTENALLWYCSPKKTIYKFDGNLVDLGTMRGISKYLYDNIPTDPIAITDYISKEVLFKLDDKVLAYDLILDRFSSTLTYNPTWFIPEFDGNLISTNDSRTIYRHNDDTVTRAQYYGTDNKSTLTHICNVNYDQTKVFDVLNWHSTSITSGINQYNDTFDRYRMYNDYQNTDWQDITWKRKERSYTTIVPRDRVNIEESNNPDIFTALDANQSPKRRMRDKYIILDFEYTNKANTTFSVPYINIAYRASIR